MLRCAGKACVKGITGRAGLLHLRWSRMEPWRQLHRAKTERRGGQQNKHSCVDGAAVQGEGAPRHAVAAEEEQGRQRGHVMMTSAYLLTPAF